MRATILSLLSLVALCISNSQPCCADDPIFSGPQIGEKLTPFEVKAVLDDADKSVTIPKDINAPLLLVFVHEVNRPAVALSRLVVNYGATKKKLGLETQLVFLSNDAPETTTWFERARHALPKDVQPLISNDGKDGPGAYGLNRKVTLTVLVAKEGKVTANFPLVQPSVQVDAPKIGQAIAQVLGEKDAPSLKDMGVKPRNMQMTKKRADGMQQLTPEQNGVYRSMMAPVIRGRTPEDVKAAAEKVEAFAEKTPWFKTKVYSASSMIVGGGKLSNYGIKEAQQYLEKWSKEFAPPRSESKDSKSIGNDKSPEPPATAKESDATNTRQD